MAQLSGLITVYVASNVVILALFTFTLTGSVSGSSNVQALLQPYDFLYYSGVRAYFGQNWEKSAELVEKSIATKESLIRVRRQCHDECEAAGKEALHKLGELTDNMSESYKQRYTHT